MGAGGSSNRKPGAGNAAQINSAGTTAGAAAAPANPVAEVKRGDSLRVIVRHLRPGDTLSSEVGHVIEGRNVPLGDTDAGLPPPPPETSPDVTTFGWFVEDPNRPGTWEPYSKESADRLEDAFLHACSTCTVVMKKRTYTVSLIKMQQLPPAGGTAAPSAANRSREVKRVPVVPYTDPVTGKTTIKEASRNLVDPFAEEETEQGGGEPGKGIAQGTGDIIGSPSSSPLPMYEECAGASGGLPHLIRSVVPHVSPIYTMETTPSWERMSPEARAIAEPAGGALVLSSGKDRQLLEWSLDTARVVTKYELPDISDKYSVLTAKYSATAKWMIAGMDDRTARLFAIGNPSEVHRLEGHTHKVYGAGILAGDLQAVTAGMDCQVKLWDIASGMCVRTSLSHKSHIFALQPHPIDPNFALTAGEDRNVCLHDFRLEAPVVAIFTGHERTIWDTDWSPADGTFASCGLDKTIRIYDPRASTTAMEKLCSHTRAVHSITYTPRGRCLLSCSKDLFVHLSSTSGGRVHWQAKAHAATVFRVRYHTAKEVMLSASSDASVNVWSWKAVKQL
ncbi:hypothetical protein ABL78_6005 [Leptomonas seymouri]|uniref:WWE domain-containing protein n=1 Tax=Leptomonas seymouri TaxID=5684 RepID=A0A0N1HUB1_LEPSE|nr:hypothetical protein ABL78_6005 [Leptomonas seymouri]|eukprot:KPI84938.1 hypothetical protein ABL78_6005 [Leptomonas seymouri]